MISHFEDSAPAPYMPYPTAGMWEYIKQDGTTVRHHSEMRVKLMAAAEIEEMKSSEKSEA